MTPSGMKPATFRLVTQLLNQLDHTVPPPSSGRISVKFDIRDLRENLPRNTKFRYNWTKI